MWLILGIIIGVAILPLYCIAMYAIDSAASWS